MSAIFIKNGTIVNENRSFRGDILIIGENIESIGSFEKGKIPDGTRVIDAAGKYVLPGIIDDQVHFREPGLTHKGTIFTESAAAAAGGVTSFMEMPNTRPPTTTARELKSKLATASENSIVNYAFYLGATNDNIDDLLSTDPELYCGVKVFMGSSTGNMLVDNETTLREIFRNVKVPVACHCEDEHIVTKNLEAAKAEYGLKIPPDMHPHIRSREACFASSSKAVALAREYGTRLHILHLSTAEETRLFDNSMPLAEKLITGEVCVHHLWFDDTAYDKRGNFIKWNPAIKTAFDRKALIEAVNNDHIDIIATDHAPHTIEEKSNSYLDAPSGGPLVQHSLQVMMELHMNGLISMEKIVEKMCHNPAILFRISDRGFLREGYKADIIIADPDNPQKVWYDNILYKCGWSPFSGQTFRSRVATTIINGNIVYDNGILDRNHRGMQLRFKR
ncbi:MAG: dihydroorotase [Bacteroidales bacterium]|nr:dihydroorotase [Bacteroidales bacterium]